MLAKCRDSGCLCPSKPWIIWCVPRCTIFWYSYAKYSNWSWLSMTFKLNAFVAFGWTEPSVETVRSQWLSWRNKCLWRNKVDRKGFLWYNIAILRSTECCVHEWHSPISATKGPESNVMCSVQVLSFLHWIIYLILCECENIMLPMSNHEKHDIPGWYKEGGGHKSFIIIWRIHFAFTFWKQICDIIWLLSIYAACFVK